MSKTDTEAGRLFIEKMRGLVPQDMNATHGQVPPVELVFAPGEQIRLKPGAMIPPPKGETNGPSSPRRGTQSPQGRNPASPARATSQARPRAARGNYTTTRHFQERSEMPVLLRLLLQVLGVLLIGSLFWFLLTFFGNLTQAQRAEGKERILKTREKEIELEAKELDLEIRRRSSERQPVQAPAQAVNQPRVGACGSIQVINSPTDFPPGCTTARLNILVSTSYGYVESVKVYDGRVCYNADDCTTLLKSLPVDQRVVEIRVNGGTYRIE